MKEKDIFTYSINNLFLLKKGMIKETMESYEEMKTRQIYIDQVFYNILINGIMKQKNYNLAFKVWQEMNERGFKYNDFTISVTIQLFSHLNKLKDALDFYNSCKYESIYVNSCLVKNVCLTLQLSDDY